VGSEKKKIFFPFTKSITGNSSVKGVLKNQLTFFLSTLEWGKDADILASN